MVFVAPDAALRRLTHRYFHLIAALVFGLHRALRMLGHAATLTGVRVIFQVR